MQNKARLMRNQFKLGVDLGRTSRWTCGHLSPPPSPRGSQLSGCVWRFICSLQRYLQQTKKMEDLLKIAASSEPSSWPSVLYAPKKRFPLLHGFVPTSPFLHRFLFFLRQKNDQDTIGISTRVQPRYVAPAQLNSCRDLTQVWQVKEWVCQLCAHEIDAFHIHKQNALNEFWLFFSQPCLVNFFFQSFFVRTWKYMRVKIQGHWEQKVRVFSSDVKSRV